MENSKKIELTNDIIKIDLKHAKRRFYLVIIVSVILICFGVYDFLRDVPKVVSCFEILVGSVSLLFFLYKLIQFTSKYEIKEGIINKVFYDETKKIYKVKVEKYKGVLACKTKLSINDSVYVICHNNNALMCYSKNEYYI